MPELPFSLHYTVHGEGPAWVFLHGFLESSTMWDYLPLEDLPIQQIHIDLPGHGWSFELLDAPSIHLMALEVQRVLDHLEISSFSVIGHSMGAYVGLELTEREGFERLVLLNSNCWSDSDQKKQDRLRVANFVHQAKAHFIREAIPNLFSNPKEHVQVIEALIKDANDMTPEAIAFAALAMRERTDFTEFVNAHPEKFTFIHGVHDRLVSVEELQQKVPNGKIHFLDCGHMVHIEAGEEVLEILIHLMKND
ncbi:MAG: alpha/beta hydrolase [Flavobacteriia bacterium]|jgi:pimeloyl-ACP methyl ester carboxylesterase|nr:alpha/beta hydrolase [Flavobacteriia bacterium]